MANLPWRVSVRLMALAQKVAMVIGIIVVVLTGSAGVSLAAGAGVTSLAYLACG